MMFEHQGAGREVRALRQANELLRKASACFAPLSDGLTPALLKKRLSSTTRACLAQLETPCQQRLKKRSMQSVTSSICSQEMKPKVCDETGAIQVRHGECEIARMKI
ncbi:hypothetical protein P775_04895 [Puniceibacterium antarcticum]|uniref:Uncharacterized protein n=2 Tax=Puniceibacterium antarcticum TaxID=1206336 RepID=A0A2G8RIE2_9RHOB|nr:hypothetical protein P775_04895 [Puniceibacterium antarcticum]